LVDNDHLVLEEFEFERADDADSVSNRLAQEVFSVGDSSTPEAFRRRMAILHDDDLLHFVRRATEVVAGIGLDAQTKTVRSGALFYQEFLPTETVLHAVVLASAAPSRQLPFSRCLALGVAGPRVTERRSIMLRTWPEDELRALPLEALDERYRRYRLSVPEAERAMAGSLQRYGQMSPVVVCQREERAVLVDGFKRLAAGRILRGLGTLLARRVELDERSAKAAVYALNCVGRQPQELEEAWIVQALVPEDGLSQVEVGELLGRHKSWVCRRLALLEKRCEQARADLRLGLLSPTIGRQLVRLPAGNQAEALAAARRESLTAEELRGVVDLLLASGTREKTAFVLEKPRQALQQAQQPTIRSWDPRLSSAGNRVSRQLGRLLDQLGRMENWLHHRGRGEWLCVIASCCGSDSRIWCSRGEWWRN